MPRSLWLFVFLLLLYLATMGGQFFISDGAAMYYTTQSIVEDGDLAVEPNPGLPQIIPGADGRFYSMYDLGQPLLAVPFYLLGRVLATSSPQGNISASTIFSVSLLPQIVTALSGVVLYRVLNKLFQAPQPALLSVVLWATGTLAFPYSKFYFPEALLTLCLLLSFDALIRADVSARYAIIAGLALGFAFAVRASALIYALPLLLFTVLQARAGGYRWTLDRYLAFFAGIAPFILLFLWHNHLRFGSMFVTGYQGQGFSTPFYVGFFGLLFSPGRSIFVYSPLLIPALTICLVRLWRYRCDLTLFVLAMLLTPLCFYAAWWTWHGGWSWGPRFLVPMLPFLLLPLNFVLTQTLSRRLLALILMCWLAGMLVNLAGVAVNFNVYFGDVLQGDYARESLIWFDLNYSPIMAHWGYLLRGEALSWGNMALANYGLPSAVSGWYMPVMLALLTLWIGLHMWQILRRPRTNSLSIPVELR